MEKMKTCFIKLNEPWQIDPHSDPPLGLLSVIGAAKNALIDGRPLNIQLLDMAWEKEIPKADVYAISACSYDFPELLKIANQIKQQSRAPIIAGGPHFDCIPLPVWQSGLDFLPLEVICRGEGEETFLRAVELAKTGKKGVITQEQLLDINTIPIPAREFLDKDKYFRPGRAFAAGETYAQGNSSTMITSRGCPHNCSFCASPTIHHHKVRYRSVYSVLEELRELQEKYGVTEIRFQDDCFTLPHSRFKVLAERLAQSGIRYRCSMRVDEINDGTLKELWASGCREIGYGIETADDAVLKLMNKRATVEQNKYALTKTKEAGFKVRVFAMTGLPGETRDTASRLIQFLEETKPDVVTLNTFMPLPGCDIYRHPEKYGVRILTRDYLQYCIVLRKESRTPFVHTISTATLDEMERNRELLKEYLFTKGITNVPAFNKPYTADIS